MAIPATKATLKTYCLRSLGYGVIDINVSDDQIDDRIDEALQFFSEYHYDGIERVYLKHQITQADIDRASVNISSSATDTVDSEATATWLDGAGYIPTPDAVISVVKVFPFTDSTGGDMFDIRYQLRLNDLYDFSSTSIMEYQMTLQHLDFLEHILVGEVPIRFNQHQQRLYLDMDWSNTVSVDEYIIIECYRKLDPTQFNDIFNDMFLKRYTTALIKRQWGSNLSKFIGVEMLGGVTMNGGDIYSQALDEINKLEEQIQLHFELPVNGMIG
jgi:hypothetical protein